MEGNEEEKSGTEMGLNLINEARIVEEIGCKIVFSLRNKIEFIMPPQEQKYGCIYAKYVCNTL